MRSFGVKRVFDRHTRAVAAAIGLLVATLMPALAPAFAAADLVTNRSVQLSSSTKTAPGVSYAFSFDTTNTAGAIVAQFCSNSPLLGQSCTAPGGFTSASASASGGATISGTPSANKVIVTKSVISGTNTFTLGNITNPTAAGPLYVRIATYNDVTAAGNYSTDGQTVGSHVDDGSIAVSITDGVNVSGQVLETLTFCVSGTAITVAGCASGLSVPTLTLGETVGSVKALTSSVVSTGDVFTQISSNASGGVVVNLKSGNACGGLKRQGVTICDITPMTAAGFTDASTNTAKFGVKVAPDSATDGTLTATGTFQIHPGSNYDATNYRLNWTNGSATDGVSSTYGDPILDTADTQPSNKNMKLTFGAQITNNTPAGNYSTNLSLIATGKF